MFKGISNEKFDKYFKDEEDCLRYLSELKWKEGYKCKKCGYEKWWPGRRWFDRRCQRCSYNESPTAGTLFHKLKFSMLKAFRICFVLSVRKKGMSSCELSRAFDLQQKTAGILKEKSNKP